MMAQARAAIATGANVAAALFGQGGNPPRNAFAIVYGGGPTNHFDNAFAPPHTNDEPTPHRWGLNRKEFQKTPTRKRTGRGSFVSLRVGGVTLATILHQPESRAFVHSLVIEKKIRLGAVLVIEKNLLPIRGLALDLLAGVFAGALA